MDGVCDRAMEMDCKLFHRQVSNTYIQGVPRTTVQRLRVDAGPKGLPEKPI
jgi:hypothetical protein